MSLRMEQPSVLSGIINPKGIVLSVHGGQHSSLSVRLVTDGYLKNIC